MVYLGYECEGFYSHKQLRNDISNSQLYCFSNKFPFHFQLVPPMF